MKISTGTSTEDPKHRTGTSIDKPLVSKKSSGDTEVETPQTRVGDPSYVHPGPLTRRKYLSGSSVTRTHRTRDVSETETFMDESHTRTHPPVHGPLPS